jgi:copper chaperone NosL
MNHYVGMKSIPEQMDEFKIFPWVIGIMSGIGVIFGLIGNRKLFLAWFIIMCLLGAAGMYDFYSWEYEYGHNLDPKAAIKIPGQGYQPPLIGSKMILNFKATSLPMAGSYFLMVGMFMSLGAFFMAKKEASDEV